MCPNPTPSPAPTWALARRLLDVEGAATYMHSSTWHVRLWIREGHLPVVKLDLPGRRGRPLRRTLIDVADLDVLIAKSKVRQPAPDHEVLYRLARARAARTGAENR